tara:strand:- start:879 stop:1181 length:303 start_codon:yes stop_codon:yes gene_type:complete
MQEKDHKIILKSFLLRLILSLFLELGFIICSLYQVIMFGAGITFILSFPFCYLLSGKFFPDSTEFLSSDHRDYLRSRKGLAKSDDSIKVKGHHFDDYKRG